ncbi:hypothetical protein ACFL57_01480 [Candidatus Margulisiibacteriota bacterium]
MIKKIKIGDVEISKRFIQELQNSVSLLSDKSSLAPFAGKVIKVKNAGYVLRDGNHKVYMVDGATFSKAVQDASRILNVNWFGNK